jgi:hypothetical protein
MMNLEKFNTALGNFIGFFREFIPQTLGTNWEVIYRQTLDEKFDTQWQQQIDQGSSPQNLIDHGNLKVFVDKNYSFWRPWFEEHKNDLLGQFNTIRVARNKAAHNDSNLKADEVEKAFQNMVSILDRLGLKQQADTIRELNKAWRLTNEQQAVALKAKFRKTAKLRSVTVFMRITRLEQRADFQKYLNTPPPRQQLFEGEMARLINDRVAEYFRQLHLLDHNGNLTEKGKTVAETGYFETEEQGKYRIWYCENDQLIGDTIVYFERENAFPDQRKEDRIRPRDLPLFTNTWHYCMDQEKGSTAQKFRIEQLGNADTNESLVLEDTQQSSMTLLWEWESHSDARLWVEKAQIMRKQNEKLAFNRQALDVSIDQSTWLDSLFEDSWDRISNRLRIEFDKLENPSEKVDFVKRFTFPPMDGFDSIEFERVPLMASDREQALKWRNWLVEGLLKVHYLSPVTATDAFNECNRKPGLISYNLNTPKLLDFLKENLEPRGPQARGKAYWHLAAPLDLQPLNLTAKSR